ncbi:MAG: leucyl/phenylalanyl-tRNA--protein transferase [Pseudorhodobacter sp.]
MTKTEITPDMLLGAYAIGVFPMAESRNSSQINWVDPHQRGIFPLDGFHISRSLSRRIARPDYQVTVNCDFEAVLLACADREETWINPEIHRLYMTLHQIGHAHSLEIRSPENEGGMLIGGVYGVTLGAVFFGESMFSARRDGSKIALAWLIHRLRKGGFTLFDTQFLTPHLQSLGAVEIPRAEYHRRLSRALELKADFEPDGYRPDRHSVRQRSTQTS